MTAYSIQFIKTQSLNISMKAPTAGKLLKVNEFSYVCIYGSDNPIETCILNGLRKAKCHSCFFLCSILRCSVEHYVELK